MTVVKGAVRETKPIIPESTMKKRRKQEAIAAKKVKVAAKKEKVGVTSVLSEWCPAEQVDSSHRRAPEYQEHQAPSATPSTGPSMALRVLV